MSKVFLYREKDSNDRDCCVYIEKQPLAFECGHYFAGIVLHGSCYCNSDWKNYDEIETVLTKAEYEQLRKIDEEVLSLGYGIEPNSDRYKLGMRLRGKVLPIIGHLISPEGKAFYERIVAEEKQLVMDDHDMTEEEVNELFKAYPLADDYQDRSIIGSVFSSTEELGEEEAYSLGYIKNDDYISQKYFNYEKFGRDLVDEQDNYHELPDGRCVYFMM